ncbi:dTDP-4-dehydrorhamnose reductase [Xylella fastidiosa]|uniref:dTDP-4-dehydrorhamnose reductase n=1 Tax=Xylella fastidiosa subsp. fastidiosa TaxID=644356 RepID=A0AAJ5UHW4_XYLFS|nr:dTDP-4-dehydrorhamnose reductase [Xylella fastidiosa]WCF28525.1 dTDP-4-dehydrorhamnose reductase [Xylella fastidiosa subsp. fastidiosa]
MTVLVFGAGGQIGQELLRSLSGRVVCAVTRSGRLPNGVGCVQADFGQPETLRALLDAQRPAQVVNAAAYTAVDRAESEPDVVFRINAQAPGVIAHWCAEHGVPLVHYSTDYVFDGQGTSPYGVDDPVAPLNIYGASKLAGECAVRAAGGCSLILRTSWVYAAHGHNFLRTMLRLGATSECLRVVADQIGTPTAAGLIADVTAQLLVEQVQSRHAGIWHLTAAGQTSWHGFAEEIFVQAQACGLMMRVPQVQAIGSVVYPTAARRPGYSCLDTTALVEAFGIVLPDWRQGVRGVLDEIVNRSR